MAEGENKVDWVVPGKGEMPLGGDDHSTLTKDKKYKITPTKHDETGKPTYGRLDRVIITGMPAPEAPTTPPKK